MVVARTKATRRVWALLTLTSIGWLRQESNQYLEIPPEVARELSSWPRALLGYTPHGSGDDKIGNFHGDYIAWVKTLPRSINTTSYRQQFHRLFFCYTDNYSSYNCPLRSSRPCLIVIFMMKTRPVLSTLIFKGCFNKRWSESY